MPKKGFKSITMKEKDYDIFEAWYKEQKEKGIVPAGIHSFTGYIHHRFKEHLDEKQSLINLANKINPDLIPKKFLETKTVIKGNKE